MTRLPGNGADEPGPAASYVVGPRRDKRPVTRDKIPCVGMCGKFPFSRLLSFWHRSSAQIRLCLPGPCQWSEPALEVVPIREIKLHEGFEFVARGLLVLQSEITPDKQLPDLDVGGIET
jgi:hypothetical protein